MKIEHHNLYTHFILVTQNGLPCIPKKSRDRIEKYISGIVETSYSKLQCIYVNPEHVHLLVSRSPKLSEDMLANFVAGSTSRYINDNQLTKDFFAWQEAISAFSVSGSEIEQVTDYISNDQERHKRISFAKEYDELLKSCGDAVKGVFS